LKQSKFEVNFDFFDRDIKIFWENNAVAFGKYFKGYSKPVHATQSKQIEEDITKMLKNKKIYEIDAPKKILKRWKLEKYISEKIKITK